MVEKGGVTDFSVTAVQRVRYQRKRSQNGVICCTGRRERRDEAEMINRFYDCRGFCFSGGFGFRQSVCGGAK